MRTFNLTKAQETLWGEKETPWADKLEALKQRLFVEGTEAIDEFLNGPECGDRTKDEIENLLDMVINEMTKKELEKYFIKYEIK